MPGCLANSRATFLISLRIGILHEDVRELMIDQRPGFAGAKSRMLAVVDLADLQQARLAQHAVGIGDVVDRHDDVFAGHQPQRRFAVGLFEAGDQLADFGVQIDHGLLGGLAVGPALLGGVIQVRQIDVEEVRLVLFGRMNGGRPRSKCVD